MLRRFAAISLSVLMLGVLTNGTVSTVNAASPTPAKPAAVPAAPPDTVSSAVLCSLCVLSTSNIAQPKFMLDRGVDLRVDGGIMVNENSWYTGGAAIDRCGTDPCAPASCTDWNPPPAEHLVNMCGGSLTLDHTSGSTPSTVSAGAISLNSGWQARFDTDIVHADQLASECPAHPRVLHYPVALQETNVCIGVPQIADPLNDPSHPENMIPFPDFQEFSSCPDEDFPYCGPVESDTCRAEPGTTLALPTGTFDSRQKLVLAGAPNARFTICPGLYFGGFAALGDGSGQPHVVMLPGRYAMINGDFAVNGTASITSVSSQGDGVAIYALGGSVDLRTTAGPCAAIWNPVTDPCGRIILHAQRSGSWAGLLIWDDIFSGNLGAVRIGPWLGAPACVGNWMAPDANPIAAPCGPLGGLSGTIYAPHQSDGSPNDWDAIVDIGASGLANLQVIAAEVNLTTLDTQIRLDFSSQVSDRLVVSPMVASIAPGASRAFTVEAFDANGVSRGDVTASSTFSIVPDGSCTGASCSATVAGSHTVSASRNGVTATATLTVVPGPFDHLGLAPANATIAAGGIQAYTAEGRDAYDNPLASVTGVRFTISPDGSCTNARCTTRLAGVHTVTATKGSSSVTATLTVVPAALDHLVLSPATATVLVGVARPYSAEGRDRFNNSLGDVTAGTAFSIGPNGSCTGSSCSATIPGNHTVSAVNAGKSGKATLTVKAGPLDHLALAPASASIALGASRSYSATGRDVFNNPLGTMSGVTYTIDPDGSCTNAVCTPASVGSHTVTGTKAGVSGTAGLTVNKPTRP